MLVKMGVPYNDVSRHIRMAWPVIDEVFIAETGQEAVLTSTTEGTHNTNSLHYDTVKYGASDFRLNHIAFEKRDDIRLKVKAALSKRFGERKYDVLFSSNDTCLHVEYDPK